MKALIWDLIRSVQCTTNLIRVHGKGVYKGGFNELDHDTYKCLWSWVYWVLEKGDSHEGHHQWWTQSWFPRVVRLGPPVPI